MLKLKDFEGIYAPAYQKAIASFTLMNMAKDISVSLIAHLGLIAALLLTGTINGIDHTHLITVALLEEWAKEETGKSGNRPSGRRPVSSHSAAEAGPDIKPSAGLEGQQHESGPEVSFHTAEEAPSVSGNKGAPPSMDNQDSAGIGREHSPYTGGADTAHEGSGIGSTAASGPGGLGRQQPGESNISAMQKIRNAIQRNLVYPYIAQKKRMEGTAMVRFKINQRGTPEDIRIIRSSGHLLLDAAAEETVVKASPFPALNDTIKIPITFLIKDSR
jgi:TonB family protein